MSKQVKKCPVCGAPYMFVQKRGWDGDLSHEDYPACD
jgi:hypothetical protein